MPQIPLNPNRAWQVNNSDDFHGNIVDTFQLDLQDASAIDSRRGSLAVGKKLFPHTTQANSTAVGLIDTFVYTDADGSAKYWCNKQSGRMFRATSGIGALFGPDETGGAPATTFGDIAIFGRSTPSPKDKLFVPTATDISMLNGTWTASWWQTTLGQAALDGTYPHCLAVFRQPFLLIIGDNNKIHTVDQINNVINSRLTLPAQHVIRWIKVTESRVYIGVSDITLSYPGVYEYDPVNETAYFFAIDTLGATPGMPLIDGNQLFVLAADGRLKQFTGNGFQNVSDTPFSKRLVQSSLSFHRNGAFVLNNQHHFLLPALYSSPNSIGAWAGLYIFDKATGNFYHKYAFTAGLVYADAAQMLVQNTGAAYSDGTNILASMQDILGGTPTGIFAASNINSNPVEYRTFITTPKIPSQSVKDVWRALWLKYFLSGSDKITVWMRNSLSSPVRPSTTGVAVGTWTTAAKITSTSQVSQAAVDQEILFVTGQASGKSYKIISATSVSGSTTLEVSDSIGLIGNTSYFIVTNFQQLTPVTSALGSVDIPTIDSMNTGEWVQFKIELLGTTPIIDDILLEFANDQVIN